MKKLFAIILSLTVFVFITGCGDTTNEDIQANNIPDLSWRQENIEHAMPVIQIGNAGFDGTISSLEILQLIENIELGPEEDIIPLDAHYNAAHIAGLVSENDDKWLTAIFYDDFSYVSFNHNNSESDKLYWLANGEEIKQFFIDNNYYMPLHKRAEIAGRLNYMLTTGNVEPINNAAQPSFKDDAVTTVSPMGQLEYLNISNIVPYNYFETKESTAFAEVIYRDNNIERCYIIQLIMDENNQIVKAYVDEDKLLSQWATRYSVADVDYTVWMQKLDTPYYNNFNYWLYADNSGHSESSMEWNSAVMNCIQSLELGESVDIDIKEYPRNQIYRVLLEEGSSYYNEKPLLFSFYDDCNYIIICDCHEENTQPVSVCEKHNKAYVVKNPQIVRDTFGIQGQYVPPQDYDSLQRFAQKYMETTSVSQLNNTAKGKKINEARHFEGKIANFHAENINHVSLNDGKDKFLLKFTTMFVKEETGKNDNYISYKINMQVYRKGDSWKMTSIYIG